MCGGERGAKPLRVGHREACKCGISRDTLWVRLHSAETGGDAICWHPLCVLAQRVFFLYFYFSERRAKEDAPRCFFSLSPHCERKHYYAETDEYRMIAGDVRAGGWLTAIGENKSAIVVMEGVSMYLTVDEMRNLVDNLCFHFENVILLVDAYTSFAAKMSKKRNPINEVGITEVYGIDNPQAYQTEKLAFAKEHTMIPQKYIEELKGFERCIFSKLYAGGVSKKLYRLYEYQKK